MSKISEILTKTSHRPWELPKDPWKYYQEWNHALFFHWAFPCDLIRPLIPPKLKLDTFEGQAYVSLVAFTMQNIRPQYLPSIKAISDFHEINLRTYVTNDGKNGVYFLNIEAGKLLSTIIAKSLSGLPYEKATISRTNEHYHSKNKLKGFYLDTKFSMGAPLKDKTKLDRWLTERYCLYLDQNEKLFRYDIHHKEWPLKNMEIIHFDLDYQIGEMTLQHDQLLLAHYSDGVEVIAWKKQEI